MNSFRVPSGGLLLLLLRTTRKRASSCLLLFQLSSSSQEDLFRWRPSNSRSKHTWIDTEPDRCVADPCQRRHLEPILFSEGRGTSPGAVEGIIALHVQKDIGQGLDLTLCLKQGGLRARPPYRSSRTNPWPVLLQRKPPSCASGERTQLRWQRGSRNFLVLGDLLQGRQEGHILPSSSCTSRSILFGQSASSWCSPRGTTGGCPPSEEEVQHF